MATKRSHIIPRQIAVDDLETQLEKICNQSFTASELPSMMGLIHRAVVNGGATSFVNAVRSIIVGPPPPWYSNISTEYQEKLGKWQSSLSSLQARINANRTMSGSASPSSPTGSTSVRGPYTGNATVTATPPATYTGNGVVRQAAVSLIEMFGVFGVLLGLAVS